MSRPHLWLAILVIAPVAAAAQRPLERADSLLAAGQYDQARALLLEWERAHPHSSNADPLARARALYLSARLTDDGARAQELYLSLALGYPTAPQAPDALLRLGQALLQGKEYRRAVGYLQRLVTDYPNASVRPQASMWLARAELAAGNRAAACVALEDASRRGAASSDIAALIRAEHGESCSTVAPPARPHAPRPDPSGAEPTAAAPPDSVRTGSAPLRYALQAGAFRSAQSASTIVAELRRRGFDARVAIIRGSALSHVRIGRFATRAEATAETRRLKAAGFSTIVVDDAAREIHR